MIDVLIAFLLGFMAGGFAGVVCMALMAIRGHEDDISEQ